MKRVSSLDDLQYYRNELARLQRELNERREAEISQMLQSSTRNRKPVENGLDELSVLAENPSYMTTLNDVTEEKQLYAPTPITQAPPILNLPDPRKYTQFTRHDGEGLPPTSSSKKSSSLKSKKEPSAFKILRMPSRQLYSPATQTFMETRKIKPKSKSKSKGGKNKTKKRKTKKTKKNKKNKK